MGESWEPQPLVAALETKKALKPPGFQGLLDSELTAWPLHPEASNNNHDLDHADASRLVGIRVIGRWVHGDDGW
jgi:hypothetical protein